jgi:mRNA interferase MazF
LKTGELWFGDLGLGQGREQSGIRPLLIVSNRNYLSLITELLYVVPCTSRDRGWPNHIPVTGSLDLKRPTFALVEQFRVVSRSRLLRITGQADESTMTEVGVWINRWLK